MDALAGGSAGQPHRQVERAEAEQVQGQQGDREGQELPGGGMGGAQARGVPGGAYARGQAGKIEPATSVLQQWWRGVQADQRAGLRVRHGGEQGSAASQGNDHLERGGDHGEPEHPGDHGGQCFQPVARLDRLEGRGGHRDLAYRLSLLSRIVTNDNHYVKRWARPATLPAPVAAHRRSSAIQ